MPLICWSFLLLVNWSNNSSFQIIFNSIIGEGNGKPLQNSCLGNFMNRGVWWATVPDVARVRHDTVTTHHHKPSQLIPKSGSLFTLLLLSNLFFWVWSHFPASCHIIIFYCTLDVVQKGTVETEVENILPYGSLCLLPANEVLSWVRAGCSLMTAVHPPVSGEWGQMSDDSFQRHLCIWYTSHGHGLFLSVPIQPPGTHLSLPTFSLFPCSFLTNLFQLFFFPTALTSEEAGFRQPEPSNRREGRQNNCIAPDKSGKCLIKSVRYIYLPRVVSTHLCRESSSLLWEHNETVPFICTYTFNNYLFLVKG